MSESFSKAPARATALTATGGMIALLAALSALGQFASNIYLPALPAVAWSLETDLPTAQATYGIFLAVFAVSQLAYGPLSDRFGRRPVLLWGLGIYLIGSMLCAVAPSIELLLIARAIQALGAGAGVVIARAVVRDSFDGAELARVLALITILFALVPGLTPLLGGITQDTLGWRAVFGVTLGLGLVVGVAALTSLPETNRSPSPQLNWRSVAADYAAVTGNRRYLGFALASACAIAAMSAFFGGSPAVFIGQLGVSPTEYGLYPPIAVSGFVIGGLIVRRTAGKLSPTRLAMIGLALMGAGATIALALPLLGLVHKHGFNLGIVTTVTGLGVLMPTAVAAALSEFPTRAGSASAFLGFSQMAFGAIATLIVGALQPALPLLAYPCVMAASAVAGAGALLLARGTRPLDADGATR